MAGIVTNIISNSLSGFVSGAVTTVGGYAGDAVGGIGNLIEGAGSAVGNRISGRFDAVGKGINSYGTSIQNATAPNLGGAVAVKKQAVKKTDTKPKPAAQKALPSSKPAPKALPSAKPMKALPAPPTKYPVKAGDKTKIPYISPEPVKKSAVGANGQKKVTPSRESRPGSKPATDPKALVAKKMYTPASTKELKPAIPGFGFADKAGSKAGGVVGTANSTTKKAPSVAGGYKPSVVGYGDKAKSQAGSVAGSVAGGPKFF